MLSAIVPVISGALGSLFFLFGYVTNESSFPQPLTPEEEQQCLEMLGRGNEEARNTLIARNLRLVAHVVKNFSSTGIDADDLNSIGSIGLMKAVNSFDQGKGTKFATYAAKCIENEIPSQWKHCRGKTSAQMMYFMSCSIIKEFLLFFILLSVRESR